MLRQLQYQGSDNLASTVWANNDRAWEHARQVLVQMDRDEMVEFLGQAFECCMCATQVCLAAMTEQYQLCPFHPCHEERKLCIFHQISKMLGSSLGRPNGAQASSWFPGKTPANCCQGGSLLGLN